MKTLFNLWFRREWPDREDTEIYIGTYSTLANARKAQESFRTIRGFAEFVENFEIDETAVDDTGWQCGIIFVKGPPPKDADGLIDYLPAYMEEYLPGGAKFDGVHMKNFAKI